MLFKSPSHAKALLVLSLVIGLSSFHFGQQWAAKAKSAKAEQSSLRKDMSEYKEAAEQLQAVLKKDPAPVYIEAGLSAFMLDVFNNRVEHGIVLANASPGKVGNGTMAQMTELMEDVPGTRLKSIKVNLAGTYETYQGLMKYLEQLQKHPVALVRLKVQEQSFEVSLRIYGSSKES